MTDVHVPSPTALLLRDDESSRPHIETQRTLIDAFLLAKSSTGSISTLLSLLAEDVVAKYPTQTFDGRETVYELLRGQAALTTPHLSRKVVSRCSEPAGDDEGCICVQYKIDVGYQQSTRIALCGGCCGILTRSEQNDTGSGVHRFRFSDREQAGDWKIAFVDTIPDSASA